MDRTTAALETLPLQDCDGGQDLAAAVLPPGPYTYAELRALSDAGRLADADVIFVGTTQGETDGAATDPRLRDDRRPEGGPV